MTTIIIEENIALPKTQFKTINDMQDFVNFFLKNKNLSKIDKQKSSFDKFVGLGKGKIPILSDKELIDESIKNKYILK